jgi:hypothetical protein
MPPPILPGQSQLALFIPFYFHFSSFLQGWVFFEWGCRWVGWICSRIGSKIYFSLDFYWLCFYLDEIIWKGFFRQGIEKLERVSGMRVLQNE